MIQDLTLLAVSGVSECDQNISQQHLVWLGVWLRNRVLAIVHKALGSIPGTANQSIYPSMDQSINPVIPNKPFLKLKEHSFFFLFHSPFLHNLVNSLSIRHITLMQLIVLQLPVETHRGMKEERRENVPWNQIESKQVAMCALKFKCCQILFLPSEAEVNIPSSQGYHKGYLR